MRIALRFVLVSVVAVLGLPLSAMGQAARPPVKIGLLLPYTGPLTVVGQDVTKGLELALEKSGGKGGGREIQALKEDDEAKPDVGITKTRKLVEADRVDALVGPVQSGTALAIRDFVHGQNVPLIIPVAGSRDITAPARASQWIFRVCETSDQPNYPMGTWVYNKTPHRKVIVMASDFVGARHQVEAFMASFKDAGGQIVKTIYPPLGTLDFAVYLAQVAGTEAHAVYAFFAGADAIRFVKAYKEYGLTEKLPLLGPNTLVDDTVLPAMGEAALGIVNVGHYSWTLDTPENRAFVRDYETKYNAPPTKHSENGYVAGQLIVAAVEALKGEVADRGKFREALRNAATQIKPPRGPIRFDRYQQIATNQYIMRVTKQGNRFVNSIIDQIPNVSQEDTWKWWNK